MIGLRELAQGAKTIFIAGHLRPDGDCVGAAVASYRYLKKLYPDAAIHAYVEKVPEVFDFLDPDHTIFVQELPKESVDLFLVLDSSSKDRLGEAQAVFDTAKQTACVDHHVSNPGFADVNHVHGEISSASEVLYKLLDKEKINLDIATAIYTGMIHDTGVFQYSSTSPDTMRIAGDLMEKGVDFSNIIDESFYQKSYIQNQVMGRVLAESIMLLDGKCIVGYMKLRDMDFYGVKPSDLDGIVSQLRLTKGVEVAMFIYEHESQVFKVSLRSNGAVDVSKIASYFGGGGHVKAAGCDLAGSMYDVINNISEQIEKQLLGQDK